MLHYVPLIWVHQSSDTVILKSFNIEVQIGGFLTNLRKFKKIWEQRVSQKKNWIFLFIKNNQASFLSVWKRTPFFVRIYRADHLILLRFQDPGLRSRIQAFRIQDLGFRIQDSEFRIRELGFRIQHSAFSVHHLG